VNAIQHKFGMAGFYKVDVFSSDGVLRRSTGWFKNKILTQGLDQVGNSNSWISCSQLGVGNSTPTSADTALNSYVCGTSNVINSVPTAQTTTPYYSSLVQTWQFTPAAHGNTAYNFSEVGVGKQTATGGLFSRQLILDGSGNPTTISVLADEYVNVTYELRLYPPLTDVTGSATIGAGTYTTTLRAASVTSALWASVLGSKAGPSGGGTAWSTGSVQPITSAPSGTSLLASSVTASTYANGNFYVDITCVSLINQTIGINSFVLPTTLGECQIGLSPTLNKDNTEQLTFVVRVSWAEHILP